MFKVSGQQTPVSSYPLFYHIISSPFAIVPLWGDKVSVLTHAYPHKPPEED